MLVKVPPPVPVIVVLPVVPPVMVKVPPLVVVPAPVLVVALAAMARVPLVWGAAALVGTLKATIGMLAVVGIIPNAGLMVACSC
jgi:hypothetical protein